MTACPSSAVAALVPLAYQGGGRGRSRGAPVRSASPPGGGTPDLVMARPARHQIESRHLPLGAATREADPEKMDGAGSFGHARSHDR